MPKKRVTKWVAEDAISECKRKGGHFERKSGEVYLVWNGRGEADSR